MFREPKTEQSQDNAKEKTPSWIRNIEHFNWSKLIKVSVGGICLLWNIILAVAFLFMFNPIFLLFGGSMYICGRYLRLVLIEEWLVY